MAASIVSNSTAATFGNSPQKTGEPLDHAKLYSGKALEFDGVGDYLDTGTSLEDWVNQDDKTMSLWVRNDGNTSEARIFNAGKTGSSTAFALGMDAGSTDNKPFYFLREVTTANALKVEFGEVQPVGTWYYYVIVQDTSENEAYIYQNGVLVSTVSSVGVITQSTSTTAKIGVAWYNTALYPFNGALSNLQLWNKAWSTSDVQYAYTNPERLITDNASVTSGITTSDLELWYPMNDTGVRSPQTVVFDAAGTNITTKNHATTTFLGDELNTNSNATSPTNEADATTGWSNVNISSFQSQGTTKHDGDYALELNEASDPTNGARAYMDLEASPFSCVDGKTYTLSVFMRHTGTGDDWVIQHGSSSSGSQGGVIATLGSGDTSFAEHTATWVHDGDHQYLNIQENGSNNNGGVFVDKLSIKEVGIATGWTDADQQQTIPQTALMDGSTKYEFDGASTEVHMDLAAFTDKSDFTMSAWIFPYGDTFTGVICGNGEDTNERIMGVQSRNLSFTNYNSDGYGSPDLLRATGNPLPDGGYVWSHVAVTYADSGSTIKWYVNGAEHTSTDTSGSWSAQTDTTASNIGFLHRSGGQSYFEGLIDEVSYWNDDLTAAQISALYNSGQPLNATKSAAASNLVGYWRNNALESTGKWEDLSTNNNHATATNLGGSVFFQEGITANLDSQGMNTTIAHPSGGAAYFDGVSDYIDLGKTTTIEGEFTLEFWLKTDDLSANTIMGTGADDKLIITDNNTLTLEMAGTDEVLDINDVGNHATDTLLINEWVHIAITRNSSDAITMYVNSTAQSDTESSAVGFDYRYIGFDGESTYFKGWLDEFKVYDKELTSGQVLKNYNHGKGKHSN